jgi:hypothetical protein
MHAARTLVCKSPKAGDSGDKLTLSNEKGRPFLQKPWGQNGDTEGTKWGHFHRVKNSLIHCCSVLFKPRPALVGANSTALHCFVSLRTVMESGAIGPPPGTPPSVARNGLPLSRPVDNFSAVSDLPDAVFLSNYCITRKPASTLKNSLKAEELSTNRMFHNGRYVKYEYKKAKYV